MADSKLFSLLNGAINHSVIIKVLNKETKEEIKNALFQFGSQLNRTFAINRNEFEKAEINWGNIEQTYRLLREYVEDSVTDSQSNLNLRFEEMKEKVKNCLELSVEKYEKMSIADYEKEPPRNLIEKLRRADPTNDKYSEAIIRINLLIIQNVKLFIESGRSLPGGSQRRSKLARIEYVKNPVLFTSRSRGKT